MRIVDSKWANALGLACVCALSVLQACSAGAPAGEEDESRGGSAGSNGSGGGGAGHGGAVHGATGGGAAESAGSRASGIGGASDSTSGADSVGGSTRHDGGLSSLGGEGRGPGGAAGEGGASLGGGARKGDGGPGFGRDGAVGPSTGFGGSATGSGGHATVGAGSPDAAKGGGSNATGADGGLAESCPYTGHVTYVLSRANSPSAEEQTAYGLITTAMDKAIEYYDCYTNITKSLSVQYVPSVSTADANINGSLRFGQDKTYMDYRTAMHEIAHAVGIGTASTWSSLVSSDKLFKGSNANAELQAINASLTTKPEYTEVHADSQHFWPYGINYQSEVKSEADLLFHCRMVMAIRKDLGNP